MVTMENWEEYAILRADDELDAAGQAALEAFLSAHPGLAEEARLYYTLRLEPDETIVFAGKESLLKPEPRAIRLDMRRVAWAAAAVLALLIGAALLLRGGEKGTGATGGIVAASVRLSTAAKPVSAPQPAVEKRSLESSAIASTQASMAKRGTSQGPVAPAPSIAQPQHDAVPFAAPAEAVKPLSTAASRLLAVEVPGQRTGEISDAESFSISTPAQDAQKAQSGLLARLAPDAERLQLVDDLRDKASERIIALRSTREKLRNAEVTVSVGSRDLFTLHF